ncbi:contactin-like [Gigantopelta aegis]|uniref:contactin-like n=1 Tax=Gigantopelta aegis TaxID=1735272 RepID=UPI001B8878F7|nr:contactin-like [Gigantopelta aegis]
MRYLEWLFGLVAIFLLDRTNGQMHVFDCPNDWLLFKYHCYKFVSFPEENFEDARAACNFHGAALLSISTKEEHIFISNALLNLDPYQRSWYTSGTRDSAQDGNATFIWQGAGARFLYDQQYWQDNVDMRSGTIVVYTYATSGYDWTLANTRDVLPYICEISQSEAYRIVRTARDYDYGLSRNDPEEFETGPYFVVQQNSMVVVGRTTNIELEYIANGNPYPTFKWYRGENFETEVTPDLDSRYMLTNGKLTIHKPNENDDAADYRCIVENKFGKLLGDPLQLSFGMLGEFSNVPDAAVNAKAYEGVAIQCSQIQYKPAVRYQWLKGDTRTFVRPEMQTYIFISANGRLYFSEVTRIDEGDYRCIAILSGVSKYTIGTSQPPTRTSMAISLQVQDQAAKADWGPEIQNDFIAVFPQPPMRGQDVRLECFAYGSSTTPFVYKWHRVGRSMPRTASLQDHNRVLLIEDAQLEDSGTYTCSVSRGSQAGDSKSINLQLSAKPYFIVPLGNKHVDIHSQLTWRCVARGNPSPVYTWYKNGSPLATLAGDITVAGSTLMIHKLDPAKHNGMYQCAAHNNQGISFSGAQLRVLSFKPSFLKHPLPRITEAAIGGNITLICDPEGAPQPALSWFRNGALLQSTAGHFQKLRNGFLLITNVQASDEGRYECKAENINGEASSSTRLTIKKAASITTGPSATTVTVNETAFLYCQASYNPHIDLVYMWRFNGHVIDPDENNHFVQELTPIKSGLYIQNAQFHHAGEYQCSAVSALQSDTRSAYLKVVGPPGEPAGVHVDAATVTSYGAQVIWTAGTDHGRPVEYYMIEAMTMFKSNWRVIISRLLVRDAITDEDTKLRANVEHLRPGNDYRFRVRAVNLYGSGPASLPSAYVHTKSAPPAIAPSKIRGGGGSVGDLTIKWEPLSREEHGGHGIGYNVYWRRLDTGGIGGGLFRKGRVDGNYGKFVNLVGDENYYLEYEVMVQATNNLGMGPNSTIETIFSAEALPVGTPTNVNSDAFNGTALQVWWDPVEDTRATMKGKVRGYQINYWAMGAEDPIFYRFNRFLGQVDTGVVIGLTPWDMFYVDVQVYNSAGLGPRSEAFVQETVGWSAFHYPQEVRIFSHGADSVRIWWRGISITYQEETISGWRLYVWTATEDFRSYTAYDVDLVFEAIVDGLEKGILYSVRIAAISAGGEGKKTPTRYFTLGGQVTIDSTMSSSFEIEAKSTRSTSSVWTTVCLLLLVSVIL